MSTYELKLSSDSQLALREGSMHFEKESAVHKTLDRLTHALDNLGIAYGIVGGMALFFHGYRRFTEDVDLLVTAEGLAEIHARLVGHGFLPAFEGSRNLRDTETGVRIEFLVTGAYPGDGKPKPVSFPAPEECTISIDGKSFITLAKLIELKLASGISNPRRVRDLADVQELISVLALPRTYSEELDPSVRARFEEIYDVLQEFPE